MLSNGTFSLHARRSLMTIKIILMDVRKAKAVQEYRVRHDATKAKLYPLFWGIIVLLTNVAGVIVYQLYKRGNVTCPACGASQSKSHLYCVFCGSKLGESCQNCGSPVGKGDAYCPHCGRKNEVLDK